MPEYLAPGVYIVEVDFKAKPIDGVSTSTSDLIGREVIAQFEGLARQSPDWTQGNEHDPGVTLIELFAWLTELQLYREGCPPEVLRVHAARLAAAALALVADHPQPTGSVLRGARFMPGQRRVWVRARPTVRRRLKTSASGSA